MINNSNKDFSQKMYIEMITGLILVVLSISILIIIRFSNFSYSDLNRVWKLMEVINMSIVLYLVITGFFKIYRKIVESKRPSKTVIKSNRVRNIMQFNVLLNITTLLICFINWFVFAFKFFDEMF